MAALLVCAGGARSAPDLELGERVYKKADCVGFHKWPAAAAAAMAGRRCRCARPSSTARQLIEVVRCAGPAPGCPIDRDAYKPSSCYDGMSKADLGEDYRPRPRSSADQEIEAVVDYVQNQLRATASRPRPTASPSGAKASASAQDMK